MSHLSSGLHADGLTGELDAGSRPIGKGQLVPAHQAWPLSWEGLSEAARMCLLTAWSPSSEGWDPSCRWLVLRGGHGPSRSASPPRGRSMQVFPTLAVILNYIGNCWQSSSAHVHSLVPHRKPRRDTGQV